MSEVFKTVWKAGSCTITLFYLCILGAKTFSITTLSVMTLRIKTLSKKGLFATVRITTFSINDTQHNSTLVSLYWMSHFIQCYAECRYAECRGASLSRHSPPWRPFKRRTKAIKPGNTNWGGRLSTVDLLIKVACFVKKVNNIFNVKRS